MLDDDPKHPTFIETVHRRGYRFLVDAPEQPAPVETTDAAPQPSTPSQPFAGRAEALDALRELCESANEGQPRLLLLSGSAGIGKTTLIRRFLQDGQYVAAVGQCIDHYGDGEPFLPFLDALGVLCRGPNAANLVDLLRSTAPTWYVQLPWLVSESDRDTLAREILGATRERMSREIEAFFEAATRERLLLLVLEDLHWCDHSTLELLMALMLRAPRARLAIVATYRPVDTVLTQHGLRDVRRRLLREGSCREVPLELLDEQEQRACVMQLLGGSGLPDDLQRWLSARTDGHPLFLTQVVEHLLERGWLVESKDGWGTTRELSELESAIPGSLREMIQSEVDRVSQKHAEVLEAASLAGFDFSGLAVHYACGVELEVIEELLDELSEAGHFIEIREPLELPNGALCQAYRFRHQLFQQVLSDGVRGARRVRMQERLGSRGEAAFGQEAPRIAAELAVHFREGRRPRLAIKYLRMSADQACRGQAPHEAMRQAESALELTSQLDEPEATELRYEIKTQIGRIQRTIGQMQAAHETFAVLASEAADAGHGAWAARSALQAAGAQSWYDREGCLESVRSAIRHGETTDDPLARAHVHGSAAYWHLLWEGWNESGVEACHEALTHATQAGDATAIALHRTRYAFFQALSSDYDASIESARLAIEESTRLEDASEVMLGEFFLSWTLLLAERLEEARDVLDRARQQASDNGHGLWELLYRLQTAAVHLLEGDPQQAEVLAGESLDQARAAEHEFGTQYAAILLAHAALGQGAPDRADELLSSVFEALESKRFLFDWLCRLGAHLAAGSCALAERDAQRAASEFARADALARELGEATLQAHGVCGLMRCALLDGDAAAARTLDERLESLLTSGDLPIARRTAERVRAGLGRD